MYTSPPATRRPEDTMGKFAPLNTKSYQGTGSALTTRHGNQAQSLSTTIFAGSPVPLMISRLSDGKFLEANDACFETFGFSRDEIIGKTSLELGVWPDISARDLLINRLKKHRNVRNVDMQVRHRDGTLLDIIYSAQVVNYEGECCVVATIVDISARKRAERLQNESEERFVQVFRNSPNAIVISRLADGVYMEANDAWTRLSGYAPDEVIGKSALDLGIWAIKSERSKMLSELQRNGSIREFRFHMRRKNGQIANILLNGVVVDMEGVKCLIAMSVDITERTRVERELRESEKRFADVLDAAGEYVWEIDSESRFTFVSPRVEKVLGYKPHEMLARTPASFMPPEEADRVRAWLKESRTENSPIRNLEHECLTKDGRRVWIRINGLPIFGAVGNVVGFRGTGLDITDWKLSEKKIRELATLDSLTQLPNRRYLMDRLANDLRVASEKQEHLAVLFIDLDRFKTINDSLGHTIGDAFLTEIATRLKGLIGSNDTLARIGGDEFVIILRKIVTKPEVRFFAAKVIATLSAPVHLDGRTLNCSASIGISMFPEDATDGATLIRNADMAMYVAKENGRHNFQFFTDELNTSAIERLTLESSLRKAIANNELQLYYHPQFDMSSGKLSGAEALIRWNHPELGVLSPARFIPIAEESGLIAPLGKWVIQEACRQSQRWKDRHGFSLPIAVNLSPGQFDSGLAEFICKSLASANLSPSALELEITESMLMKDIDSSVMLLNQIAATGVSIAIDDFGTGYSSLAYLRRFRINTLKIDKSFVQDIADCNDDAAIVDAIIALGHSLGLDVIAEGVETTSQLEALQAMGCDQSQGFLYGKPVPAQAFEHCFLTQATSHDMPRLNVLAA